MISGFYPSGLWAAPLLLSHERVRDQRDGALLVSSTFWHSCPKYAHRKNVAPPRKNSNGNWYHQSCAHPHGEVLVFAPVDLPLLVFRWCQVASANIKHVSGRQKTPNHEVPSVLTINLCSLAKMITSQKYMPMTQNWLIYHPFINAYVVIHREVPTDFGFMLVFCMAGVRLLMQLPFFASCWLHLSGEDWLEHTLQPECFPLANVPWVEFLLEGYLKHWTSLCCSLH